MEKIQHTLLTATGALLALLLLSGIAYFYFNPSLLGYAHSLLNAMKQWDTAQALIWFCMLYCFSALFFIPLGLPLNLFAGLLWGTFLGGLLVNFLATIVASLSFLLARWLGHLFVEKYFYRYPTLTKAKQIINRYDWQFIFMARINPIVPFSLSNYLFGLVPDLSFRRYIITTILANLIPCFAFAALGTLFDTFTFPHTDLPHLLLKIGLAFLLLSAFLLLKVVLGNKKNSLPAVKESV